MKVYLVINGTECEDSSVIFGFFEKEMAIKRMNELVSKENETDVNCLFKGNDSEGYSNGIKYYEIKEIEIL